MKKGVHKLKMSGLMSSAKCQAACSCDMLAKLSVFKEGARQVSLGTRDNS